MQSGINFLKESSDIITLEKDKPLNAIIYCKGHLYIKGEGFIIGTVICDGDIYTDGKVIVKYSEVEIKKILDNYAPARKFFKPGEIGMNVVDIIESITNERSKVRTSTSRYKITKWVEGRQ